VSPPDDDDADDDDDDDPSLSLPPLVDPPPLDDEPAPLDDPSLLLLAPAVEPASSPVSSPLHATTRERATSGANEPSRGAEVRMRPLYTTRRAGQRRAL